MYISFSFTVVHMDMGKSDSFLVRGAIGVAVGAWVEIETMGSERKGLVVVGVGERIRGQALAFKFIGPM